LNELERCLKAIVDIHTEMEALTRRRDELVREISESSSATLARAHWLISVSVMGLLARGEAPSAARLQEEIRAIAAPKDRFAVNLSDSWLSNPSKAYTRSTEAKATAKGS
jgi:EAL domain-containing protein (putative c-di-GMP-specific phosphodiesterase class I)